MRHLSLPTYITLVLCTLVSLSACQGEQHVEPTPASSTKAQSSPVSTPESRPESRPESTPVPEETSAPTRYPLWLDETAVREGCEEALKSAASHRDAIKAMSAPQLQAVLGRYNQLMRALDAPMGMSGLLFNTHPKTEVREAAQACEQSLSSFNSALGVDRELYERFAAIPEEQVKTADAQAKRLYALTMRDFKRSGVNLDAQQRERLKAINDALTKLTQQFSKNVNGDTKRVKLSLKELKGMPEDFIKARRKKDEKHVELTTDYPDFYPFQQYAEDRGAREKLYSAFMQRGYPANVEVLKEVLALRHEYAQLLGAPTWAEYNAGDKMVGDAKTVDEFLKKLVKITRPITDKELKQLLKRIKTDHKRAQRVEVWDRFYYTGKLREELHSFDAKSVRPYFPYQQVKEGVFALYGELFGLEFKRDEEQPTTSPEVEAYTLHRGGELIGRFFLDMHPRADKYKHAAMFPIQTGLKGDRLPVASLVCNFPKPSEGEPGLMEHGEVTTLFHEFGHLIHHLLAQESPWVRLGGINVEWDFVEAPSQLLEEWTWSHEVLKRFAKHHETGEVIPEKLVNQMRAADEFGKGVGVMRQLFYAAYSFYLHQQDPKSLNLKAFTADIYKRFSPYRPVKGGAVYANFGHLMGYSSMYYTYQWSLVIAKDLWTRFEAEGLMSPSVARDYADKVLAPGGTLPASKLAEGFLGRPYNMEAYERWLKR